MARQFAVQTLALTHRIGRGRGALGRVSAVLASLRFQRLTLAANAGQVGNEGRNIVRGPGFARTDASLFKNFDLPGGSLIQFRIEAFNLFNNVRFGQPGGTIGTATFGVITSADDGRIIQLGIKYQF